MRQPVLHVFYELKETIDNYGNEVYTYNYEADGRVKDVTVKRNGSLSLTTTPQYDTGDNANGVRYYYSGNTDTYTQTRDNCGRVTSESTPLGTVSYDYDGLGRVKSRTAYGKTENYSYMTNKENAGYTTAIVNKQEGADGSGFAYQYDKNGNIVILKKLESGLPEKFTYDELNRLTREDMGMIGWYTFAYGYDERGNNSYKDEYYYTVGELCEEHKRKRYEYVYEGDRLISYDGKSCEYDENGNPLKYFGADLTWTRGRLLECYDDNLFYYNADGIRYKKNSTEYILDGSRIIAEQENWVITKRYFYDGSGIAGMWYDGANYYFHKNLQGDVVAIFNESGEKVASYSYDPWGVVLTASGTMASVNPFRYRGYYYDTETKLYYLNSRYYDPETGRFISPDTFSYLEPETVNGLNLYAYALNNPVMYCDPNGHIVISAIVLGLIFGAAAGAVIGGTVAGVIAYSNSSRGWELFGWTILGIVGGGILGGAIGAGIAAALPTISSFLSSTYILGNFINAAGELVAVSITGAQIVQGVAIATLGAGYLLAKRTGKESSSDKPSWVNRDMVDFDLSPQDNAKNILNNKYGPNNWRKGAGSEFSKIVKWIARKLFFK